MVPNLNTMGKSAVEIWPTWEQAKQELLKYFGVDPRKAVIDFYNCKEANEESIISFAYKLAKLAKNMPWIVTDEQKIDQFTRGLHNKLIASALVSRNITALKEAVSMAVETQQLIKQEKRSKTDTKSITEEHEESRGRYRRPGTGMRKDLNGKNQVVRAKIVEKTATGHRIAGTLNKG